MSGALLAESEMEIRISEILFCSRVIEYVAAEGRKAVLRRVAQVAHTIDVLEASQEGIMIVRNI